jgi:hypothetical protein
MKNVIHNPYFWGHIGRWYHSPKHPNGCATGAWLWDENEPMPEGVSIWRNRCEPVYTGELADRVKAELNRRREVVGNNPRRLQVNRFAGLCLCDACGYTFTYFRRYGYVYLRCNCATSRIKYSVVCNQYRSIRADRLQIVVHDLLLQILEAESPNTVFAPNADTERLVLENRLAQLDQTIADERKRAARLIDKQASAPASLADTYDAEIFRVGERLELLKNERAQVAAQTPRERPQQGRTLADVKAMGLDHFWAQDDVKINQMLLALFGDYRLLIREGQVVGIDKGHQRALPRRRQYELSA